MSEDGADKSSVPLSTLNNPFYAKANQATQSRFTISGVESAEQADKNKARKEWKKKGDV
jgi:hypothetical protein